MNNGNGAEKLITRLEKLGAPVEVWRNHEGRLVLRVEGVDLDLARLSRWLDGNRGKQWMGTAIRHANIIDSEKKLSDAG